MKKIALRWFNPGKKVYWRGRWFDKAMVIAFTDVERVTKRREYFYQGSYNSGVAASAGTHDGGGCWDGPSLGLTHRRVISRRGLVAQPRTRKQGFSPHDHGFLLGDVKAARGLKAQMVAWASFARNGLLGNGYEDSGVRNDFVHYLDFRAAQVKAQQQLSKPVPTVYLDGVQKSRKFGDQVRPYYSVKLIQRALNKVYKGNPLKVDGVYGDSTIRLYNRYRRSLFTNPDDQKGFVGHVGLKALFKKAGMRVNIKADTKGKNL